MLKWIKRLLLIVLFAVTVLMGVVFASENNAAVALILFGFQLPELSLGLWVLIAVLLGAIIGVLLSFLPLIFNRYTRSSKDKKINQLQKELAALRVSGLKRP